MSLGNASGTTDRFDVCSADGAAIAVWVDGDGPAIVLVHGSFTDHTAWTIPVEELRSDMTTFAMDRRGFGASGAGTDHTIERDFEDVAAVIDAVAERTGGPVAAWGHSYGANCAMGGAALTNNVHHLVLYEPSLGLGYPPGAIDSVDRALEEGDREKAVSVLLFEVLAMSADEVEALRSGPRWPLILAGAASAAREARTEESWVYRPGQFDRIAAPTLLLAGSASPEPIAEATRRAADAIPDSRIQLLDGHGHFAHRTDPAVVGAIIRDFLRS